jgi:hypothetical protein
MLSRDEFSSRKEKLAEEACRQFAQFSKTPELTPLDVVQIFSWWRQFTLPERPDLNILAKVKRDAASLNYLLEKLHYSCERAIRMRASVIGKHRALELLGNLAPSNIAHVMSQLSELAHAAGDLEVFMKPSIPDRNPLQKQRRTRITKTYPGLGELVYFLEQGAQRAGGSFSVHRKLGPKGSLIRALDWLRAHLVASGPPFERWAIDIPPPGKHPVALYERVLKAARR